MPEPGAFLRPFVGKYPQDGPYGEIVDKIRRPVAFNFLEAINNGHPGSISTIHADSPQLALERMAMMVLRAGLSLSRNDILDYARSTIDLVIQTGRHEGRRGVLQVFMPALA